MYWDVGREVEAIQRRMMRRTRAACFIAAVMAHLMASLALLTWQTSCFYPRCVDGVAFDIVRALVRVPLFLTPWVDLPSPDADFVRGWALFGLLIVNAAMASALYSGITIAARRGCARLNRSRASSACSATHGR
jgi:hypothetical protein